jgi:conjugal transfer mating pair stabilization protein TraG
VPENPDGESGGNYNAVIGDPRSSLDLGRLTLRDVYALMARLLAEGRPSTAVGRYQIVRETLRELQARKELPSSALFTPHLQDECALSLLMRRNYRDWWLGRIRDLEFAHDLACEWASLPDPENGGRSHYDRVGTNHAGTTLEAVWRMLAAARAAHAPTVTSRS